MNKFSRMLNQDNKFCTTDYWIDSGFILKIL